jgi:ribosome-associated protein
MPGELMEDKNPGMERKSKSQVKREMLALQALGEELTELSAAQIGKIAMPEDLREAVLFAKTLKKDESRRRHLQYIGTLMRDVDPAPIQKFLDDLRRGQRHEAELFRKLENWRDELIDGNDALMEDILNQFLGADRQQLRRLVLNARKEKEANKPPKSSRALFRHLRELSMS